MERRFKGEILKKIRTEAGLTSKELSVATGIPHRNIVSYEDGGAEPAYAYAVIMAEFFNVDAGVFAGAKIPKLKKDFQKYREEAYERYLLGGIRREPHGVKIKRTWPYNLYYEITGEDCDKPFTKDQYAGLNEALRSIKEKYAKIIYAYYHDENTLEDVSKKLKITYDKARYAVTRGTGELRQPHCVAMIKYGLEYSRALNRIEDLKAEIAELDRQIREKKKELASDRVPKETGAGKWTRKKT